MDLDFILFQPPKMKYSFVDFWGEVIFIPKTKKRSKESESIAQFLNCYKASKINDVHLSVDAALLEVKGGQFYYDIQSTTEQTVEDEEVEKYIPCLYLNSMVGSKYLLIYFHASGEDIKLSFKLLNHLRNFFQINVLSMEYPGYSLYKGKTDSDIIKEDSQIIYNYAISKFGFKQSNIIVMGRSIGTGVALNLMTKNNPGALVLISPFASIKSLAKQYVGALGSFLAKETFDNKLNIETVTCPTFFLHGKADDVISMENSIELSMLCHCKKYLLHPNTMNHAQFDFYQDLSEPLRQFLMSMGFNFYEPSMKGPEVSEHFYQCPDNFKI